MRIGLAEQTREPTVEVLALRPPARRLFGRRPHGSSRSLRS
jgi:hypothetical protein